MNSNLKLNKLPMFILVIVLISVGYYSFFLGPIMNEISSLKRTIASNSELQYQEEGILVNIKSLNESISNTKNAIYLKKSALLYNVDSSDILALLSHFDKGVIVKKSIIFYDPVQKEDFSVFPVRLSFSANYSGLLGLLEKLDKASLKSKIVSMQISISNDGAKDINPMENDDDMLYNLNVDMTLNFYFDALTDNIMKDDAEL